MRFGITLCPPDAIIMQLRIMQLRPDLPPETGAGAWKSFEIAQGAAYSRVLIICDHATNLVPPEYCSLGLDDIQLNRHIAYDIGALAVARPR